MCFLLECGRCSTIPIFHNILEVSLTRFKSDSFFGIVNDSVEESDIGSANDSMLTLIHPQNLASLFPQKVQLMTLWQGPRSVAKKLDAGHRHLSIISVINASMIHQLKSVIIIREFIGKSNFLILYWF
ncbi:hypothetical protein T05_2020 [Trichinella murrelli]|uniref:Uncharacterized protein n=1 Tax=Trichinella murrelli TaxID=144512 RepID=A0A0V0TBP8_9BILA|nr:hypothetical protein T05_2020 [Trichinella murrelli]